jgi:hypothetical protein
MQNEYYTTSQIAGLTGLNNNQVIYRAKKIITTKDLLFIDNSGTWRIHKLLLHEFKKVEKNIPTEYSYTANLPHDLSEKEIANVMKWVVSLCMSNVKLEYTIERKKKDNFNHIHAVLTTRNLNEFKKNMKLAFHTQGYKHDLLYDRERWLKYITKDGHQIITITNKKTN